MASFFFCWFPFQLVAVWFKEILLEGKYKILHVFVNKTSSLVLFNSYLNPMLYVFVDQDFRERLIRSLPASLERALSEDVTQTMQPRPELNLLYHPQKQNYRQCEEAEGSF